MKIIDRISFFCFLVLLLTSCLSKATNKTATDNTLTDIEGNVYKTKTIGTLTWMVENLKTTHFNDGTAIPYIEHNRTWGTLSTPACCWYDNDATYKNMYGALYNWYAVNTGKLAPVGWHVASEAEWKTLTDYVSANLGTSLNTAKALAAKTDWTTDSIIGTVGCNLALNNSTGFSALPGGYRYTTNGKFGSVGYYGYWWTSTQINSDLAWGRYMDFCGRNVDNQYYDVKQDGLSVRCVKDYTPTISDADGNVYHTITIGTQTWMVENLKTTHYRNGNSIENVTDKTAWSGLSTGAWCDYNNDASNCTKYGHLYNWYAVSDARNIAPVGWHVPTDAEWTALTDYVSAHLGTSLSVGKALAAKTDWTTDNTTGTVGCNLILNNSTGFSALPGGFRFGGFGTFDVLGGYGSWWTATESYTNSSWVRTIYSINGIVKRYSHGGKTDGLSVRCIKD